MDVPSNPFRANSSDAAAMICRRRSGPFRSDFGFFSRTFVRSDGFVILLSSINDEEIQPERRPPYRARVRQVQVRPRGRRPGRAIPEPRNATFARFGAQSSLKWQSLNSLPNGGYRIARKNDRASVSGWSDLSRLGVPRDPVP